LPNEVEYALFVGRSLAASLRIIRPTAAKVIAQFDLDAEFVRRSSIALIISSSDMRSNSDSCCMPSLDFGDRGAMIRSANDTRRRRHAAPFLPSEHAAQEVENARDGFSQV
jgi:hypothetical protein